MTILGNKFVTGFEFTCFFGIGVEKNTVDGYPVITLHVPFVCIYIVKLIEFKQSEYPYVVVNECTCSEHERCYLCNGEDEIERMRR